MFLCWPEIQALVVVEDEPVKQVKMVDVVIELDPLGPLEADSDGKFSKIFGTTLSSSNSVPIASHWQVLIGVVKGRNFLTDRKDAQ